MPLRMFLRGDSSSIGQIVRAAVEKDTMGIKFRDEEKHNRFEVLVQ